MDVGVETLQAFLENAWDAAPEQPNNLRNQLRLYEQQLLNQFSSSGSIGTVSKNSASQSYRGPGLGIYTLIQLAEAWRKLINFYQQKKCETDALYNLSQQYPNSPQGQWFIQQYPTYGQDSDQAVYDFMTRGLQSVDDYQVDMTFLRLQPTAFAGGLIEGGWPGGVW